MSAAAAIAVGGKDATLSSSAVYSAALNRPVSIDPSALAALSKSNKPPVLISPPPFPSAAAASLPLPSSRAALLILLSKLLSPSAVLRPTLPLLLAQTLTGSDSLSSLNFADSHSLLQSLADVTGSGQILVTSNELAIIDSSAAASVGICALLDCCVAPLAKVADAVAGLSCEAAGADVGSCFDLPVVGDGNAGVGKFKWEVACAMKEFVMGSKCVGKTDGSVFAGVPSVHGRFRKAVKVLHEGVREALKGSVKIGKVFSYEKEGELLDLVSPIALGIRAMGKISLDRARAVVEAVGDQGLKLKVGEEFEKGCPKFDELKSKLAMFHSVVAVGEASSRAEYILAFQNVYEAMTKLREILAWEAGLALFALETDDSVEKVDAQATTKENGESSKGGKKSKVNAKDSGERVDIEARKQSKKGKKKALGKGTSLVRQLLRERLPYQNETVTGDGVIMFEWARELTVCFDPQDVGLDALLGKVKEILESNDVRRLPKIPKGTRDFGREDMAIREHAFSIITGVFKMHGATALDTPVFELRETLMGKYGEDSKLVYDLADQGGELCSLRYDLTVPFARYLAMNNLNALKRYQVAKVYRRDNPSSGRYREFYQCDFDIAGQYETMEADFEVLKILTQLLDRLDIGEYEIKLNHRKLLNGMLDICGVSSEKFQTVCSSIDKLDKQSFDEIRKELVEEKGLAAETAEKIHTFVRKRGPPLEILSDLKSEGSPFLENAGSLLALEELEILFKALDKSKCLNRVVFDLSLARGLDYYTGCIFEAVFKGTTQVGSIAAGGRYDDLVGMFKGGSGQKVPAVGVSLGIERVFTIIKEREEKVKKEYEDNLKELETLEKQGGSAECLKELEEKCEQYRQRVRNKKIRSTETQVLVTIVGKDLSLAAELTTALWDAGIAAEYVLTKKIVNQIGRASKSDIPWMVIVGESEISAGVVKLKDMVAKQEYEVRKEDLAEELRRRLNVA